MRTNNVAYQEKQLIAGEDIPTQENITGGVPWEHWAMLGQTSCRVAAVTSLVTKSNRRRV